MSSVRANCASRRAKRRLTCLVGGELGLVEVGEVDAVVEDRPQRAVGVAEVVAVVFGLGQIGEGEVDVALGEEPDAAGLALDASRRTSRTRPPPRSASASPSAMASPPARGSPGLAMRFDAMISRPVTAAKRSPSLPEWQGWNVVARIVRGCWFRVRPAAGLGEEARLGEDRGQHGDVALDAVGRLAGGAGGLEARLLGEQAADRLLRAPRPSAGAGCASGRARGGSRRRRSGRRGSGSSGGGARSARRRDRSSDVPQLASSCAP